MSILILNVKSHERCPYEKFLQNSGEELILLTSKQEAEGFHEDDYAYIEAFDNYRENGCVELRAIELYERFKYHTIFANTEADILRAAKLRKRFNLKGQSIESAINFRDKVVMKTIAQQHGIPTASFAKITCSFDLIEFVEKNGFPVLLKPIDGAASQGMFLLKNKKDLEKVLRHQLPPNYKAETFIEGEMCHVDGIIQNGRLEFICASKYLNEPMNFMDIGYLGAYTLDPKNPLSNRLIQETKKVLETFDTPENTIFHAEWFHTPDDQIIFCEIASRTAGGITVEMIDHSYGVNLYEAFAKIQVDLPLASLTCPVEPKQMAGLMQIGPKPGTFLAGPTVPPPSWVVDYQLLTTPGQSFNGDLNTIREFISAMVVVGETEEIVKKRLLEGFHWFHQHSKWQLD